MMKWSRSSRKDGDDGQQEELVLFRDMQRRDRDRILTLLQPVVSDDLLDSNNSSLYRLPSAKRSSSGLGLLEADKNDYDWLKTPPATPLFPSLEMEVNAPDQLALHKEIPIIQPLSRFAGGGSSEQATKANGASSKSPMPKPKIPSRSVTPGVPRPTPLAPTRPLIRPRTPNAIRVQQAPRPELAPKIIQSNNKYSNSAAKLPAKFKSSGREVSPLVRSQTPVSSNPVGFSDHGETQPPPPNLRTNRSSSASRGRPLNPTSATLIHPKQESVVTPRRQSCSPTLARGRKTEDNNILVDKNSMKEKNLVGGNGSLVFGSKMVEKVMNARKSIPVVQEKEVKLKARITMHESSGFGGMKSKSSLHMPLKHMEIKRDPSNPRHVQSANSSILDGVKSNSNLSNQASQVQVTWRSKGVGRFQSKE